MHQYFCTVPRSTQHDKPPSISYLRVNRAGAVRLPHSRARLQVMLLVHGFQRSKTCCACVVSNMVRQLGSACLQHGYMCCSGIAASSLQQLSCAVAYHPAPQKKKKTACRTNFPQNTPPNSRASSTATSSLLRYPRGTVPRGTIAIPAVLARQTSPRTVLPHALKVKDRKL